MKITLTMLRVFLVTLVIAFAFTSCQKMNQPALGDYPKDANPPGGPLKFYVAFDGTTTNPLMNGVDSMRANFPSVNSGTSVDGIAGKAYKGAKGKYAKYGGVNEFGKANSFTIAFWMKKAVHTGGTQLVFCMNTKDYSWTNTKLFLEFEDWSTATLGNCKFYIMDQWVEYINANGMPNVMNDQWHHLAFTYDGAASTLKAYIDGAIFRTNTIAGLGNVNFGDFNDFTIGGPNDYTNSKNDWLGFWDGSIDQFRLYGTVLTAAEVNSLFTNKK